MRVINWYHMQQMRMARLGGQRSLQEMQRKIMTAIDSLHASPCEFSGIRDTEKMVYISSSQTIDT